MQCCQAWQQVIEVSPDSPEGQGRQAVRARQPALGTSRAPAARQNLGPEGHGRACSISSFFSSPSERPGPLCAA